MRRRERLATTGGVAQSRSGQSLPVAVKRYRADISSWNPLLWCLVVLVWLCVSVCGTSSQDGCFDLFETYDQGVYVCHDHPDLLMALQIAETMGREQCQRAFERERWNCSGFSILKAPNITSRVTKEAAYVHALSLAAIAHSVAKVCAIGRNTSCSCDGEDHDLPQGDGITRYELGCSDNVDFGISFATNFLRKRHIGSGLQQQIEWHNMRIGAQVVLSLDDIPYICRCVGVSGSCTLQTCQYELPDFSVLSERIEEYYFNNHTCKSVWNNIIGEGSGFLPQPGCDNYLKYMYDSPNYCVRNEAVGSLGTVGRECDPHSSGSNSCNNLCTQCGRGHRSIQEHLENNCWCEFVFCCEIQCSKCPETRYYHICT